MGEHAAAGARLGPLRAFAAVRIVLVVGGLLVNDARGPDRQFEDARAPASTPSEPVSAPAEPQPVVRGQALLPKPRPTRTVPPGPELAPASTGRVGTGLALGPLATVEAPVGPTVSGTVTTAVANLPNQTGGYGYAKPHPEPYLTGLRRLGATKKETLLVEDSSRGLHSAVAAGIDCVIVDNDFTRPIDFSLASGRIKSLAELKDIVLGSP